MKRPAGTWVELGTMPEIDDAVEFTGTTSHQPGDIVFVNVTDSSEYDLYGEEVSHEFTK